MPLRHFSLLLPLFVSSLLIACSAVSIDASAEAVYRQMTVNEAYDFYGSSIDCVYYSTTGYKHVTLVPSSNRYSYHLQTNPQFYGSDVPSWVKTSELNYVVYYANVSDYSSNPSYLGVSIDPNVHFTNCNALRFCAASYLGSYTASSQAYDESFIRIFGHTELRYTNTPYISDNIFPYMSILRGSNSAFRVLPVWADYTSDTLSTVSMLQVGFNGVHLDGNEIDVYLSCPLVNDSAVGGTGIVTGTNSPSTGTDINVNVDVDMTETNGLLGDIISSIADAVSDIIDGIGGLFVPDEDYVANWIDDLIDLIKGKFSFGVDVTPLEDALLDLATYGATTSIQFPGVDLTDCGIDFVIPSRAVDLKPLQDNTIYTYIELAVNIAATFSVFNLIQKKIKAVIVGERVVDIEGGDDQ